MRLEMTLQDSLSAGAPRPPGEEAVLLVRLRNGEDAAYAELVSVYGGRLLAVARRFMRSDADAQDALQDAFLQAFKALPRFAGQSALSTWLHRIVVNAALMRLRSRRSRPEESIEEMLPTFLEDGHQTHPSVEWGESSDVLLERREVRELVRTAIDRLPDTYRTVLLLRDIEELDTGETAEILGVTENAVKVRLHRARQALREQLDPCLRRDLRKELV